MATARERAGALAPIVDEARREVERIDADLAALEAESHRAFAAGDIPAGEKARQAATERAESAPRLRDRLATLLSAEVAVAGELQAEELRSRRETLAAMEQQQLEESARQFAQVMPHVRAARKALLAALAAEREAMRADGQRQRAEVALGERQTVSPSRHYRLEGGFDHPVYQLLLHDRRLG